MVSTSESLSHQQQQNAPEWIPCWLRKSRAMSVAAFCIVFAVCLEVLNIFVNRNHGLSLAAQYAMALNAARYLPTFGAICLGFMWKAVVQDAKKITPWAAMTGKWSKTSDSVGLDYVTTIEPVVFFSAARLKHWAVFVGLLFGFVCGSLVAVANSLTFVDLSASYSESASLLKTTTFEFAGISDEMNDGYLPTPSSHLGQKAYAAVAAERLPGGQSAPWSKDNYVFESFTNTTEIPKNSTVQATVRAFFPSFLCHSIEFAPLDPNNEQPDHPYFRADVRNRPGLNCSNDVLLDLAPMPVQGQSSWLNLTACADGLDDIRLISMMAWNNGSSNQTSMLGVMCTPSFLTREVEVRADWASGRVLEYKFTSSPAIPEDIQTSMFAIYIYLNNPVDARTQFAYPSSNSGSNWVFDGHGEYGNFTKFTPTPESASQVASLFLSLYGGVDPFNDIITNHLEETATNFFRHNPEQYRAAVEQLSNTIISQTVNSFGRGNVSKSIDETVKIAEPKLFVRQFSLKTFQILLCLVAIACILEATALRPKTSLIQDPGPIASVAVLLAACEDNVNYMFASEAITGEKCMEIALRSLTWQLHPISRGSAALRTFEKSLNSRKVHGTEDRTGFRPLSLRLWAKISVLGSILAVMVVQLVLLVYSHKNGGLCHNTVIASTAFNFIPTVILLLLGYACSGIDGSIRTMAPYRALSSKLGSTKSPLLFNLRDVPSIWVPLRAIKNRFGSTVVASSFAVLLIPAVKIITAGLYDVAFLRVEGTINTRLDVSLMNNLVHAIHANRWELSEPPYNIIESASSYAEWALIPSFNIGTRLGILENMIFSNITPLGGFTGDKGSLSTGEITARVPAISVDVKCNAASTALYGSYRTYEDTGPFIEFTFGCNTESCNKTINGTSLMLSSLSGMSNTGGTINQESRFQGATYVDSDLGYQVLLADWRNIMSWVTNNTYIPDANANFHYNQRKVLLRPGMLNVSNPDLRVIKCYSSLTRVTVDTTFTLEKSEEENNTTPLSSWTPVRYNASSLRRDAQYESANIPYWMAPFAESTAWGGYQRGKVSTLSFEGNSLWPSGGSSSSFFELLAAYGEYKLGNISAILDIDNFVEASTAMYTAYVVNLLTELRSYAMNLSAGLENDTQTVEAKIVYSTASITQDFALTVASECLLLVMFLCFAWVSFRFPNHAILPKNPGSIAARASLLANSRLVERLRSEKVTKVKDAEKIWQENAGLGWWPAQGASMEENKRAAGERAEDGQGRDEIGEDRIRAVDRVANSSSGQNHGCTESTVKEEEPSDPLGEPPEARPSDEEAAPNGGNSGEHDLRWGIDIGEGMIKGSWYKRPGNSERQ